MPSNATLTGYTERDEMQFWTVEELNTLFGSLADLLNAKVDIRQPETSGLFLSGRQIKNLAEGSESSDAVTVAQMQRAVAEGLVTAVVNPSPAGNVSFEPWVPIEITDDNIHTAVYLNMDKFFFELQYKVRLGSRSPMLSAVDAGDATLRQLGTGTDPTDAATYQQLLELLDV